MCHQFHWASLCPGIPAGAPPSNPRYRLVRPRSPYYGLTPHRTRPHRTAPDPKILGDGNDQTPQRTGDKDTLFQRGYGPTTLPPVQPRGEIHNFNPTAPDLQTPQNDRTGPQ